MPDEEEEQERSGTSCRQLDGGDNCWLPWSWAIGLRTDSDLGLFWSDQLLMAGALFLNSTLGQEDEEREANITEGTWFCNLKKPIP
ncbi:hypothetical protein Dimus_004279 [Dionaea muscipula]